MENESTFKIDRQEFFYKIDPRTGIPYIKSIHPYDETEYHWARRVALQSNSREWRVCRGGKYVLTLYFNGAPLNEEENVARYLMRLDAQAQLHRTGGIW